MLIRSLFAPNRPDETRMYRDVRATLRRDVMERLRALQAFYDNDSEVIANLSFISFQLILVGVHPKQRRYTPELYAWNAAFYTKSAAAYR